MKSTGIVRKLDELGRVVIPKEIRNKLDIEEKDPIEIYLDGTSIILRKFETGCIFCNNSKDLVSFKDKLVCKKCLSKITDLNNEEN
ncbi:MAG: AbrB/MazE/SpoVT family DNA-binding domain-containing protein [Clostridia bacterium]